MTVSRRRDVLGLVAFVVMCFGVSVLGGRAVAPALAIWYPALVKPSWTPPSWVFGPVWTLLYPLVAVAGWLAWREGRSRLGTLVFLLQLALNAFQGELTTEWHYLLAMTVITLLPVTLVFAFLQRHITTGIASAGVK